jgi:hypothetical protein
MPANSLARGPYTLESFHTLEPERTQKFAATKRDKISHQKENSSEKKTSLKESVSRQK